MSPWQSEKDSVGAFTSPSNPEEGCLTSVSFGF